MDAALIEQVKIQAQILVPLLKALRVELGKERAIGVCAMAVADTAT
jgi:hypothetical protein